MSTILFLSSSSHLPPAVLMPAIRKAPFSLSHKHGSGLPLMQVSEFVVPMSPRLSAVPLSPSETPPSHSSRSLYQGLCRSSAASTLGFLSPSSLLHTALEKAIILPPFFLKLLLLFGLHTKAPIHPHGSDFSPFWAHML